MKKFLLICIIIFSASFIKAGNWNPYVNQGIVAPAPMLPWQFNGTGECSFNVGNSGSDDLILVSGQAMLVLITLSSGVPNNADPIAALGGTWKTKFNWTFAGNTYTGTQNMNLGAISSGTITIQYKVTVNTSSGSPNNGFNVNLTPPAYTGGQPTNDDAVSSYTYTLSKDFGDAPESYGSADHTVDISNLSGQYCYMGSYVDCELANQPSAAANGDDLNQPSAVDDEDGVTIPALIHGQNTSITIVFYLGDLFGAYINAWIDWNGDGDFEDTGERVKTNQGVMSSPYTFIVSVPADAITSTPTFARFRFGPTLSGSGGSANYGEVEDFQIQILSQSDLSITKTDGSPSFGPGTNTVYTVVVGNAGPDPVTGATVNDLDPAGGATITGWTTAVSGGATVVNSTGSGAIVNESVTIPVGGTVTYTVTVAVPCSFSGNLINTATVTVPVNVNDPTPGNNTATDTDVQNEWIGGGTTDWNTAINWSQAVVPSCSPVAGAVIPAGHTPYPVITTTGNLTASLTIQNGAMLTINPGKDLKVCGCTKIGGTDALYLKSDGTNGNASFVTTQPYAIDWDLNTGSAKVELWLTACYTGGEPDNHCWHYVSPPVKNALSGVFTGDWLKTYSEPLGSFSDFISVDDYPLGVMQGFLVHNDISGIRTFHGELNDGTVTSTLTHTAYPPGGGGWNIVGNPYPSEIDITTPGALLDWTNVDKVVYYFDQALGNYSPYNILTGLGSGSPKIPSMQGFFVHVNSVDYTSGTLKFTDDNRTTTGTVNFYKDLPNDLIWLKVNGKAGMGDEVIVYFQSDQSSGYDQGIDVIKFAGAYEAPQLSAVATDNQKLAIDALPFAGKNTVVPLEFYVTLNGTGDYSITASKMESFRAGTRITLEDKKTNINQVLSENPVYNFSYIEGENSARFLLHFYNPYFGIDDKEESQQLIIYSYENNIYVKDLTGKELKGQMIVYNLVGQSVATKALTGGTLNKFSMNVEEGYYIVEVITGEKTYHGKVYLRR